MLPIFLAVSQVVLKSGCAHVVSLTLAVTIYLVAIVFAETVLARRFEPILVADVATLDNFRAVVGPHSAKTVVHV